MKGTEMRGQRNYIRGMRKTLLMLAILVWGKVGGHAANSRHRKSEAHENGEMKNPLTLAAILILIAGLVLFVFGALELAAAEIQSCTR